MDLATCSIERIALFANDLEKASSLPTVLIVGGLCVIGLALIIPWSLSSDKIQDFDKHVKIEWHSVKFDLTFVAVIFLGGLVSMGAGVYLSAVSASNLVRGLTEENVKLQQELNDAVDEAEASKRISVTLDLTMPPGTDLTRIADLGSLKCHYRLASGKDAISGVRHGKGPQDVGCPIEGILLTDVIERVDIERASRTPGQSNRVLAYRQYIFLGEPNYHLCAERQVSCATEDSWRQGETGMTSRTTLSLLLTLLCIALCPRAAGSQGVKFDNIYGRDGNSFYWNVYVDENPSRLRLISCVQYTLYPSFTNPVREVCDGRNRFALEEGGRGEFPLLIRIDWRNHSSTSQSYQLDLHSESRRRSAIPGAPLSARDPVLQGIEPAALAYLPSGVMILDSANGGRLLQAKPAGFALTASLHEIGAVEPGDLAATRLPSGEDAAYVMVSPRDIASPWRGFVKEYIGAKGQTTIPSTTAPANLPYTGIAIDDQTKVMYLASAHTQSVEFYSVHLNDTTHVAPRRILSLMSVDQPRGIGPMTVDGRRKILFAADVYSGQVFRINLAHISDHKQLIFKDSAGRIRNSLGSPLAMAFDADRNRLFVADQRSVWVARMNADPPLLDGPWRPYRFGKLTGLTLDSERNVWICDSEARALFVLSTTGELLRTYRY